MLFKTLHFIKHRPVILEVSKRGPAACGLFESNLD